MNLKQLRATLAYERALRASRPAETLATVTGRGRAVVGGVEVPVQFTQAQPRAGERVSIQALSGKTIALTGKPNIDTPIPYARRPRPAVVNGPFAVTGLFTQESETFFGSRVFVSTQNKKNKKKTSNPLALPNLNTIDQGSSTYAARAFSNGSKKSPTVAAIAQDGLTGISYLYVNNNLTAQTQGGIRLSGYGFNISRSDDVPADIKSKKFSDFYNEVKQQYQDFGLDFLETPGMAITVADMDVRYGNILDGAFALPGFDFFDYKGNPTVSTNNASRANFIDSSNINVRELSQGLPGQKNRFTGIIGTSTLPGAVNFVRGLRSDGLVISIGFNTTALTGLTSVTQFNLNKNIEPIEYFFLNSNFFNTSGGPVSLSSFTNTFYPSGRIQSRRLQEYYGVVAKTSEGQYTDVFRYTRTVSINYGDVVNPLPSVSESITQTGKIAFTEIIDGEAVATEVFPVDFFPYTFTATGSNSVTITPSPVSSNLLKIKAYMDLPFSDNPAANDLRGWEKDGVLLIPTGEGSRLSSQIAALPVDLFRKNSRTFSLDEYVFDRTEQTLTINVGGRQSGPYYGIGDKVTQVDYNSYSPW